MMPTKHIDGNFTANGTSNSVDLIKDMTFTKSSSASLWVTDWPDRRACLMKLIKTEIIVTNQLSTFFREFGNTKTFICCEVTIDEK